MLEFSAQTGNTTNFNNVQLFLIILKKMHNIHSIEEYIMLYLYYYSNLSAILYCT
jgi:hypothetical protein